MRNKVLKSWGCSGYLLLTDDFRYRLLAHDKSHIALRIILQTFLATWNHSLSITNGTNRMVNTNDVRQGNYCRK